MRFKKHIIHLEKDNVLVTSEHQLPQGLISDINSFEEMLVNRILIEQKDSLGINKIGKEIRKDRKIEKLFKKITSDYRLTKFTENKRSFRKVFFDLILCGEPKTNIIFLYNKDFNRMSRLVDGSLITPDEIISSLKNLCSIISFKDEYVFILIEIEGFSEYTFIENKGFSKLTKNG